MKYLKVTFLFFFIFSLLQFTSCNNKERIETSKIPSLDSVSFYMHRMKDASFGDSISLNNANKALKIEKKLILIQKGMKKYLAIKFIYWAT